MSLIPKENKNIPTKRVPKKGIRFLTKNFPQLTRNLLTNCRLLSFPKYVGLGTRISIAGIRKRLNKKETAIPNDTSKPISLTFDNSWVIKLMKLITVVIPARKIGIPSLFIVLLRISVLLKL